MKRIFSIVIALAMILSCASFAFAEDRSLSNFKKINEYAEGMFNDVSEGFWFTDNVKAAYEFGLMVGSNGTFNPNENISVAEAVTLASRLHSIYEGGSDEFEKQTPWYQSYVDYAVANGIIEEDYFWDYSEEISRNDFVAMIAKALPSEAFPAINAIEKGMISDVDKYIKCKDQVYMLYNAGVLTGVNGVGDFEPYSGLSRSAAAAIVTRIADKSLRQTFGLKVEDVQSVLDRNYNRSMGIINGKIKSLFTAPNRERFYIFSAPATDELRDTFYALDVFDDDYEEQVKAFFAMVKDATFEDAASFIPAQAELDKYVGKTLADLEADGFSEWGYLLTDDYLCYTYTNKVFECDAEVDMSTGSEEEPSTYVIKNISFSGLSSDIIEEALDVNAVLERVKSEGSVRAFYDNGFAVTTTNPDDSGEYPANFTITEDGKEYYYKVVFEFTEADKAEYDRIEALFDEDFERYFDEREAFICGLKVKEVNDLSAYLPKEGQLSKYAGGTFADLEADGFVLSEGGDSTAPYYMYENEYYSIVAMLDETTNTLSGVFFLSMK